ncbi:alkaline phosphatase family protein [Blastopirellula sp. J2-11]|uniref:alkaline phosphatase family protein n=1 Tax=Blastopirellula sp. J2-11 TaxID=2943192 RepID=UPI0021C7FF16|nr:nucleotide pyrophosphatase/phosphodiesterase family protein [Blastopirellula sp. J2-11]UUO08210.1 alkaline phosphatase family protein [Blastopirellula sp. J2-11]
MPDNVVLLSLPGLSPQDLAHMPQVSALVADGDRAPLAASFPAVTWPVQANMLTGQLAVDHGVTANGFYWRDTHKVEMWTAGNEAILQPQIWDLLKKHDPEIRTSAWFPMLSKRSGADYVCMPAPVHNPDGSETMWCYTKPSDLYGDLLKELDGFPLHHFWGPMANIKSSAWIADSAAMVAEKFQPHFSFIYLPHLDYAAQKLGPQSDAHKQAAADIDEVIGKLVARMRAALGDDTLFLIASEYVIVPVDHVSYPNRILREAGLLQVEQREDGEHLDLVRSDAWALVDHQFSQVYVKDAQPSVIRRVQELFQGAEGIAEVLALEERAKYYMDHERAGEVILVSAPNSWQAYYWWINDDLAPGFARKVDIHQKPGYDPVEMHFDFATKSIPLDATLVKGSHGAPVNSEQQQGVFLSSQKGVFAETPLADTDVCDIVLRQFGV